MLGPHRLGLLQVVLEALQVGAGELERFGDFADIVDEIGSGRAQSGRDDAGETYEMLYFDERGVSRKFQVALRDNICKAWRNAPGFSQRLTRTIVEGGNTIIGKTE